MSSMEELMSLFTNEATSYNEEFNPTRTEFNPGGIWGSAKQMWEVDDRLSANPSLKHRRDCRNAYLEAIYEAGCAPPMEGAPIPEGLISFVEKKFLAKFMPPHSRFASIESVVHAIQRYLDWEEPYFFLVDMPISITEENFLHTYRVRKTGSILDPSKIETMRVNMGWKFPHYTYIYRLMEDERTKTVLSGGAVAKPDGTGMVNKEDVLDSVLKASYGNPSYANSMIESWMNNYYEDLRYDSNAASAETIKEIEDAADTDVYFWKTVAAATFTWFKSHHGLRYLIKYHPVYYELLDWDTDQDKIVLSDHSRKCGWCVIDGWSILTAMDLDLLDSVSPGTCSVTKQELHCAELVNVPAVRGPCACGNRRDVREVEYYSYNREHRSDVCKLWESKNPIQTAFICYGSLYNILSELPADTKCPRHSCPNTKCSLHAGGSARISALTQQRIKMLPSSGSQH